MGIKLPPRSEHLKLIFLLFILASTISGCSLLANRSPKVATIQPVIGSSAPDFSLEDLNGKKVKLSDFRGQPVMVNFWATWCGPCKLEMPHMQEAQDEISAETGFKILAVNLGEDKDTAYKFLQENKFSFTALIDKDRTVAYGKYKLIGLPTSFFIDRDGVIRDIQTGPLATKEHLMSKLKGIL